MKLLRYFAIACICLVQQAWAEPVVVVSTDSFYLATLITSERKGVVERVRQGFALSVDLDDRLGEFGRLAEDILFSRKFDTRVTMYRLKDQNEPLKHIVFGNINRLTSVWARHLPEKNLPNQLYHIHGHFYYHDARADEHALNRKIVDTFNALLAYLMNENMLTPWFSGSTTTHTVTRRQDGPHKPGSWAIYLQKSPEALEAALNFLINRNEAKHPYFIHAVTERDPRVAAPNLKDYTQNLMIIGSLAAEQGGVDWSTQFDYAWIESVWVNALLREQL